MRTIDLICFHFKTWWYLNKSLFIKEMTNYGLMIYVTNLRMEIVEGKIVPKPPVCIFRIDHGDRHFYMKI